MIYLLMPDRFANGNTKMIVMQLPPKNTIGNFPEEDMVETQGIINNLDYISALGATT
jgi:glycosidase